MQIMLFFTFVVVSFFGGECGVGGGGPRNGEISPKIVEGACGKKFGNHCTSGLIFFRHLQRGKYLNVIKNCQ